MKPNFIINTKHAVFSIAIVLIFASCAGKSDKDGQRVNYKIIQQANITEDPGYFKVDKSYPFFVSDDETLNKKLDVLNRKIESYLDTAALYFWGVGFDEIRNIKDETNASGLFELKSSYQILDTSQNFISLKMETYSYALGAHGFTAIHTYNFFIDDIKFLKLTDLLNLSKPEYLNTLNQLLVKYFENPGDCFDQEPTADENFGLFAIEGENLLFFYEAYELGAYYCGMAKIAVPISELKEAGLWKWEGK